MKGNGQIGHTDPGGIFRKMFDREGGVAEFIKDQERITEVLKVAVTDRFASRGRSLIHMVKQSKNGTVGRTWRDIFANMSIGCRYEVCTELFKMNMEVIAALSDADLGKRAKQVFRDIDPQHADGIANRFLRDCLKRA